MPPRVAAFALSLALCASRDGRAQNAPSDSSASREIVPGVTLRRIVRAEGPVTMHVLEVDLRRPELAVRALRACDRGTGRERPSAIARRLRGEGIDVIAAINAGFFDLEGGTGASESNVVVDGDVAKGVEITESPFDKFDNVHSQFGFTTNRHPVIDRFRLTGTVRTPRDRLALGAVNGIPIPNKVVLYTVWSGRAPPFPSRMRSAAAPLELVRARGDGERPAATSGTWRYRVLASAAHDTATDTTGTHALLVGAGSAADGVARLKPGDIVTVTAHFSPDRGSLRTLVGGWPRIVTGGVDVAAAADSVEGTFPRFAAGRHPRSAVGFSRDSATLFLVAIDGRQTGSVGMTLVELAKAMIGLGVHDALNLDGGGSTALVVGDTVVNKPSDQTGERPVGDVLVITREQPASSSARRRVPARTSVASCVTSGNHDPDRVARPAARPATTAPE